MRELENKILDILIDIKPVVPNMEVAKAALKIVELIKKSKKRIKPSGSK